MDTSPKPKIKNPYLTNQVIRQLTENGYEVQKQLIKEHYKPTLQTKFNDEGNCLSAVYATLFDIPIDNIPLFQTEYEESNWLIKTIGKFIVYVTFANPSDREVFNNSLLITAIESESNNPKVKRHAVISKGGNIIFDPLIGEVNIPITSEMKPSYGVIGDMRIKT